MYSALVGHDIDSLHLPLCLVLPSQSLFYPLFFFLYSPVSAASLPQPLGVFGSGSLCLVRFCLFFLGVSPPLSCPQVSALRARQTKRWRFEEPTTKRLPVWLFVFCFSEACFAPLYASVCLLCFRFNSLIRLLFPKYSRCVERQTKIHTLFIC